MRSNPIARTFRDPLSLLVHCGTKPEACLSWVRDVIQKVQGAVQEFSINESGKQCECTLRAVSGFKTWRAPFALRLSSVIVFCKACTEGQALFLRVHNGGGQRGEHTSRRPAANVKQVT